MEDYLRFTKSALADLSKFQKIHCILGNEACDLDSTVSSITYGHYLNSVHNTGTDTLFLPLLNIPRADFRLRTETTYFLSKVNLPLDHLTFRDEVDLHYLHTEGKLVLTLVDQNVLPGKDAVLEDAVVTVIDHRPQERPESDRTEIILDLVGSCCTLIGEQLLQHPFYTMDDQIATLLYGTIITDTINQSPEAGKTTPRDTDILKELSRKLPEMNGQELYEDIQNAKYNISGLKNHEILVKDLKKIGNTNMSISMCSITMELRTLLEREHFFEDLQSFCAAQGTEVAVLMTLKSQGSTVERQLAVYSENRIFRQQIADLLDTSADPSLQLEPVPSTTESILCFSQGNVKASRKKVLPILKSFLTGEETPGVDTSGFPFEGLETDTIGSDVPLTNIKDSFNQESIEDTSPNSADPFNLFSGGGESKADNGFRTSNPFAEGADQFSAFLQDSNANPGDSYTQQIMAGSEFDPFALAGYENLSEQKTAGDSFIDGLLSGSGGNSGSSEQQASKDMLSLNFKTASGQESPLELSSELTSAGSSYPVTPPNSYMESDMERFAKEHNLPSFNSSEMVKIIKEQQESVQEDENETDSFPFAPKNSYQQSPMEPYARQPDLPNFQSEEMYQRIMDKRASLGGELEGANYGFGVQFEDSSDDGFKEKITDDQTLPSTDNVVALGLAQDIRDSDPFASTSQTNAGSENVVAQNIAEHMQDEDPFSLGITQLSSEEHGSFGISDNDPFSLGLNSNSSAIADLNPPQGTMDADPFSLGLTENATSLQTSDNNVVASSIAEELKSSNPFVQDPMDISPDSDADLTEADLTQRAVREPSVENFQDFMPEVERNVISPGSPTKHEGVSSDKVTSNIASNLEEMFGYNNLEADIKENPFKYNTDDMADAIVRKNLEETQKEFIDQMAGFSLQGTGVQGTESLSAKPSQVTEQSEANRTFSISGFDNPAFASSMDIEDQVEFTGDNAVASGIAEEMKADGFSEESVNAENVVAGRLAEEMKSGEVLEESVNTENVVAAGIAEEMKGDGFSEESVNAENVVAATVAEEMKADRFSEDSVNAENVVAGGLAEEMKSSEVLEESVNAENVVAARLVEEMRFHGVLDESVNAENVVAARIAEEMKGDGFSEESVNAENVVAETIAEEMIEDGFSEGSVNAENVVDTGLAEEIKSDGVLDESLNAENAVGASLAEEIAEHSESSHEVRMESGVTLRSDNVMTDETMANEIKSNMFAGDTENDSVKEKKKRKGVMFAEFESGDFESLSEAEGSLTQNFKANEPESEEFEIAQKFAENIISEACEIVAKDDNPPTGSVPKGLSRREMALRMMEADEFDSESSPSDKEPSVENLQKLAEGSYGSNEEAEDDTPESEQHEMPTYEDNVEEVEHDRLNYDKTLEDSSETEEAQEHSKDILVEERPEVLQLGISANEEEPEDVQHDQDLPEDEESGFTIAQRLADTVVSEAVEHFAKEQDAEIAQRLAEAMEESEGEGDQTELTEDKVEAKSPKTTRFADEGSEDQVDDNVEKDLVPESTALETFQSVNENQEHIDREWDSMPEFETDIHRDDKSKDSSVNSNGMISDLADLSPNSEEAVREVAFDMASDIIQKALDTFPTEELPAESDGSLSSPPSSDISPNSENYPQSTEINADLTRSHEMCPLAVKGEAIDQGAENSAANEEVARQSFELSLETEYLPNVDPFHGSLELVTSPVHLLETDANKDIAENTSFKQLSTELASSQSESESEASVIEDISPNRGSSKLSEIESVISSHEAEHVNEASIAVELTDARSKVDEPASQIMQSVDETFRTQHASRLEASQFSRKAETLASADDDKTVAPSGALDSKHKKEIYMTTAGRISISTDYPAESEDDLNNQKTFTADTIAEESRQQVGEILARAESVVGKVDEKLACASVDLTSDVVQTEDVTDEEFLSKTKVALEEAMADTDEIEIPEQQIDMASRVVPIETEVRLRQDSESSDTMSKSARPGSLSISSVNQPKRKIHPNIGSIDLVAGESSDSDLGDDDDDTSLSSGASDLLKGVDDLKTPDIATPDALGVAPELEWDNETSTPAASPAAEAIPEYTAEEESRDQKTWKTVTIGDQEFTIDMRVVEPYKRVLSHGGYYGEGLNAMIVFSGCYLPDRSRKDYSYVMENLFFYVISTLELLVAEDYMIVYFHGATPRKQMPSFGWLKRCYQMIDRRLKKNLKGLLLVHPTLWIKTVVMMSRPFISSKFSSKLRMVRTLADLEKLVPMEYVFVPDEVRQIDKIAVVDPKAIEQGFDNPTDLTTNPSSTTPVKKKKKNRFWKRKK